MLEYSSTGIKLALKLVLLFLCKQLIPLCHGDSLLSNYDQNLVILCHLNGWGKNEILDFIEGKLSPHSFKVIDLEQG